uniref:Ig-like domain-containing protein n=2 Tax=viral metagenome TaxID=1070528 RepID=A0A6M3JXB0_9ZZZZ
MNGMNGMGNKIIRLDERGGKMAREQLTREEAIQILTRQRDFADDAKTKDEYMKVLEEAGDIVGYAPAFRCLVKGQEPEVAIRWGK